MENLSPMMRQYHDIKRKHPGMLLFFRLGDFYEMFFEDAILASRELEITLTSRNRDRTGDPIPMCGVPHHAVNNYLARLVGKGHKVALCEQTEDPRQVKGIVRREVTRIVTPGTTIEEGLLDSKENNFIAGLVETQDRVGASFLDLSTGEFLLSEFSGTQAWSEMQQELVHFQPRELILSAEHQEQLSGQIPADLRDRTVRTPQSQWTFNLDYCKRILLEHFQVSTLDGFGLNGHRAAICAAGALLHYVKETQKSQLAHITHLNLLETSRHLKLDESTVLNLELVQGFDGNKQWTLLAVVDLTETAMGARLLRSWMLRPSLELTRINERLDAVQELSQSVVGMDRLSQVFKPIQDLERLLSRVTMETANARDLLALKNSLQQLPRVSELLDGYSSRLLSPQLDLLQDLVQLLEQAIAEEPPVNLNEGGLIRTGFHSDLDELREITRSGKSFIARLESQEREKTAIPSLKVKYNRVFGYFIEITKTHLASVPAHYIRKQTLVGCERYITPELKEYEEKVLTAQEKIFELEKNLFFELRKQVGQQAQRIQQTAQIIACIDCLLALAQAAKKYRWVRPQLDESHEMAIRGGRHPVVELQNSDPFVPNDLLCQAEGDQLLILTGPNMGGKSTYLRQNALIVIMAQMGSFVPADEAHIGIVDRIFTRVGASDNLARGRSTFMVEMIETATILNSATPRSFILLDEVGRGTATFDGLSIAWSVAEYLLTQEKRKARTLFATHYQELTKLEDLYEGAKNYCVRVQESDQKIVFFHRVAPGVASKSYGIEVARLAGLPQGVIGRAREILSRLERKELKLLGHSHTTAGAVTDELQKNLF
jgi:DNA mismatch repair protein MutS